MRIVQGFFYFIELLELQKQRRNHSRFFRIVDFYFNIKNGN
jgi:hypothetical protein